MWLDLIEAIFILSLFAIFFQDIKDRLVNWWLFPLMGISGMIINYTKNSFLFREQLFVSLIMLLFLFVFMGGYLKWIKKIKVKEMEHYFGLGDILFIIAWAVSFNPFVFLKLFIIGLLLTLLVYKLVILKTQANSHVPLAGLAASFIILAKLADYLHFVNLYNR